MKSNWLKLVGTFFVWALIAVFIFGSGYATAFFRFDQKNTQSSRFALNIVRSEYVDPLDDQMMAKAIVQGIGDPYSVYFTKDEFSSFEKQLAESYVGIGVLIMETQSDIASENGKMMIQKVFKNSPAQKNNVMAGWEIKKVDGTVVTGKGIEFTASKIKGKIRTQTTVVFYDPIAKKEITLTLTRDNIQFETVESKLLSDKTGYLIIHSFNVGTAKEFERQLDSLLAQNPKQILLDLRNNGGGILEETLEISKRFLDSNSILFYTQGRDKQSIPREIGFAKPMNLPLIILVNRYSASASEVLSGSIQDNKKGRILGEKTYGKAAIQRIFPNPLTGEAVKITVQKYLTPSKKDISHKGIEPDIAYTYTLETLNPMYDFEKDPVVQFAIKQFTK
jgi:carboxyl-terminal processing protease